VTADLAKKLHWLDSRFSHTTRLISSSPRSVGLGEIFGLLLVQSIQNQIRNQKQETKEVKHPALIISLSTGQKIAKRQEREPDDEITDPFVTLSNNNGSTKRDGHVQFIDKAIEVNADTAYKSHQQQWRRSKPNTRLTCGGETSGSMMNGIGPSPEANALITLG
jgi:hypothetical protein